MCTNIDDNKEKKAYYIGSPDSATAGAANGGGFTGEASLFVSSLISDDAEVR